MGDLSTREQIRAEAIERLAVGQFEIDERDYCSATSPARAWAAVPERVRQRYRVDAEPLVDALGDLLPTGIEWGVYLDGMGPPNPFRTASESTARSLLDSQDDHVVRKYTHDWIEVTE